MTGRPDPFDRLRLELGKAAERLERPPALETSVRHRWRVRLLISVAVGALVAGTATAAIITRSTTSGLSATARPNVAAAKNLGPLLSALQASRGALARQPLRNDGPIRGMTSRRQNVTVDVAVSVRRVCLAGRTTMRRPGSVTCSSLPIQIGHFPYQLGATRGYAWLAAVVPDGVSRLQVRGDNGGSDRAVIANNVAVAIIPGARRVVRLTFLGEDGRSATREVSQGASNGTEPSIRRLHVRPRVP